MRNVIVGVLIPAVLLTYVTYLRVNTDEGQGWHPQQVAWWLWWSVTVASAVLIGAGLYAHWFCPRPREPFDHDAVQLDADGRDYQ